MRSYYEKSVVDIDKPMCTNVLISKKLTSVFIKKCFMAIMQSWLNLIDN
ncbi:hypothetical protein KKH3_05410 [Pectobacterium actinidiae]|nr:hypothetical protein KKH3_05410 [Pectobacterium actinidiae]